MSGRDSSKGMNWMEIATLVVLLALGALYVPPFFSVTAPKANQMKATNNCRQIIMSMKAYAADHNGDYPKGTTANEVFRELIRAEILQDERIFGCMKSPFVPDQKIGSSPDYRRAVEAGENHWMMMDGQSDSSSPIMPVVFENAVDATWPPSWDATQAGKAVRGRTWGGGKIVIGLNDNSVSVERTDGADLRRPTVPFMRTMGPEVILDIEE